MQGRILKGIGSFYTVADENGDTTTCRLRGKLRRTAPEPGGRHSVKRTSPGGACDLTTGGRTQRSDAHPLPGDQVDFDPQNGVVDAVLPRRNVLTRPAVANIDLLCLLISDAIPQSDPFLIDTLLTASLYAKIGVCLVVTKTDIAPAAGLIDLYKTTTIPLFAVSAATGAGVDALNAFLAGKICCFAGNSGVGKSTLINLLLGTTLATGEVSEKLGRGRHTTRETTFLPLPGGGYFVDTPGFASFETAVPPEECVVGFPEFAPLIGHCRFDDCRHCGEPGCAVAAACERGEIHPSRIQNYMKIREEKREMR